MGHGVRAGIIGWIRSGLLWQPRRVLPSRLRIRLWIWDGIRLSSCRLSSGGCRTGAAACLHTAPGCRASPASGPGIQLLALLPQSGRLLSLCEKLPRRLDASRSSARSVGDLPQDPESGLSEAGVPGRINPCKRANCNPLLKKVRLIAQRAIFSTAFVDKRATQLKIDLIATLSGLEFHLWAVGLPPIQSRPHQCQATVNHSAGLSCLAKVELPSMQND